MFDPETQVVIGGMVWTVPNEDYAIEDDDDDAPPMPPCVAARLAAAMWVKDLAAHRQWLKSQRPDRAAEIARANAYYDAVAAHTRALGMCMM